MPQLPTIDSIITEAPKLAAAVSTNLTARISNLGKFVEYYLEILAQARRRPFRGRQIVQHIEFIGNQSLVIILLTGFFTGAVFGLQIGGIFTFFGADGMMGGATGIALATELAPLISAFLLTGRVGAAMTAEIATMVVNEQVDAMEAMAVNPVHYLIVPRVLASLLTMPLLCGIFMFIGVIGTYAVGVLIFQVDAGVFKEQLVYLVEPADIIKGLRKMLFFSFIISTLACRFGLSASKGAKGVGDATTNSVVTSLLAVLCSDFLISYFQIRWGL